MNKNDLNYAKLRIEKEINFLLQTFQTYTIDDILNFINTCDRKEFDLRVELLENIDRYGKQKQNAWLELSYGTNTMYHYLVFEKDKNNNTQCYYAQSFIKGNNDIYYDIKINSDKLKVVDFEITKENQ